MSNKVTDQLWYPSVIVKVGHLERYCVGCLNFKQAYFTEGEDIGAQVIACSPGPKPECIDVAKNWKPGQRPDFSKINKVTYDPSNPPITKKKGKSKDPFKGVVIDVPKRQPRKYLLNGKEITVKEVFGTLQKAGSPKKCGCGKDIVKGEEYVQTLKGPKCLKCSKGKIVQYKVELGEQTVCLCKKI